MPGILLDGLDANEASNELNSSQIKENLSTPKSPRASPSLMSAPSEALDLPVESCVEPSIEQLYDNVCEMASSSDGSLSRQSFGSDGEESRIDSELRHLVGGEMEAIRVMVEEEDAGVANVVTGMENGSADKKHENTVRVQSFLMSSESSNKSKKPSRSQVESDASLKSSPKHKGGSPDKGDKSVTKPTSRAGRIKKLKNYSPGEAKTQNGTDDPSEAGLDNPDLGPFLLKHARDLIASDNPRRALKYALRAAKSFEKCAAGKRSLDLVMSLHVIAAIYCNLGRYAEAVPVLQHSIEIPVLEEGQDHALAKFSGYMQLGDTYAMLGQLENSIQCYTTGLQIQKQVLGDMDPRVGETCRYIAEAHVQALQFDEAEKLCQTALDIHRENGAPASLEETADRRLMGLICDTKGEHEIALEHLVLASMAMAANGQETDVASVDCSIGDIYLSLCRYDEAVFAYQKALTVFKSTKGENHPTVASVFVRLADLYNKTGKLRESKSYCENALRIYGKPIPGTSAEEIASGLTDVSAIYESMNEHEQALKLLQKALKMYDNSVGQQSTIAGIEAQMGVLYYIIGNYGESYASFKNAITKLRACGEKKSAFFGIALNQMGLACVQRYAINEAAELFEEARSILEQEYGPYHQDTLGVCSNLAGTYDAMGRLGEAIEILEYVVGIREEKLGTANPDVDDEKRRLAELLKEAGRVRNRKARSLETLLDTNQNIKKEDAIAI
ncbi:protein KINESIN LIGHT CHAIN-RELATED 2 [Elaeis guineensis]|uniref:Protein KINESIN LIGHT CHAIN-RELATED 2 n=1 Tax=Elaeis guineensis var. tenera TaxID=51953 RepID=A0A6I9S3V5_ELAGV|nr:protein KINESIN LIGHT CHAIN-RELATED 2 [Elaeis guineensis]XP_019710152.1 protein KINESIN LIGHT CHAIN-RELATED 2 [Elaeis guineensis]